MYFTSDPVKVFDKQTNMDGVTQQIHTKVLGKEAVKHTDGSSDIIDPVRASSTCLVIPADKCVFLTCYK